LGRKLAHGSAHLGPYKCYILCRASKGTEPLCQIWYQRFDYLERDAASDHFLFHLLWVDTCHTAIFMSDNENFFHSQHKNFCHEAADHSTMQWVHKRVPCVLMTFASPRFIPIERSRKSTRRVSIQVKIASCFIGFFDFSEAAGTLQGGRNFGSP
jgi:hypothetical protein